MKKNLGGGVESKIERRRVAEHMVVYKFGLTFVGSWQLVLVR